MKALKCSTGHSKRHMNNPQAPRDLTRKHACTFNNCEYKAVTVSKLNVHMKNKHTPGRTRDFQCALCPARFYNIKNLRAHIQSHLREKQFKCSSCNFATHTQASLCAHRKYKHENSTRKVKCSFPGCNYSTADASTLKKHQKTHETDPDRRCPFLCRFSRCSYRATERQNLERHVWARHNPDRRRNLVCALCQRAFYESSSLQNHITCTHTRERVRRDNKEGRHGSNSEHSSSVLIPTSADSILATTHPGVPAIRNTEQNGGDDSVVEDGVVNAVPVILLQRIILLQLV